MKVLLTGSLVLAALLSALAGCKKALEGPFEFKYQFNSGSEGWTAGFADYPVGTEGFYEIDFQYSKLPMPLDQSRHSLMVAGNNHSDDLFMFVRNHFHGLAPETSYAVEFEVEFASNAPTNAIGIGGPPGEGVTMKAGATAEEPLAIIDQEGNDLYYRMNIDKGNQANGGADMIVIGHVGVSDTTSEYTLKTNSNQNDEFTVTTDSDGGVWVIVGTDSGFEGRTTLYYSRIIIRFKPMP